MSKSKFNFKDYVKIDGSQPIGSRLMEEHEEAPEEITEKQLDRDRVPEKEVTIEKLLEKNRDGGADELTEGRLNTETSKLAEYRNPSAFEGDMNKVEEWRLANDPVEDEKYTDASSTPKDLRWWEQNSKSPDGLKVANKKKHVIKIAQGSNYWDDEDIEDYEENDYEEIEELSFDDDDFGRIPDVEEGVYVEKEVDEEPVDIEDGFEIIDKSKDDISVGGMQVEKQKELSGPINGYYMLLSYDPLKFNGDEEAIKDAALSKAIDVKPELSGLINADDFSDIKEEGEGGTIVLRAIGDEFAAIDEVSVGDEDVISSAFEEVSYDEGDAGGTSVVSGSIKVSTEGDVVVKDIVDFINSKHPDLNITEDALDLSKLDSGIVSYVVAPLEAPPMESEFPIEDSLAVAQAQSVLKKN